MVKVLTLSGKTVKVYDDELEVGHVELPSSADCEAAKLEHDASQNDHPMPDLRPPLKAPNANAVLLCRFEGSLMVLRKM